MAISVLVMDDADDAALWRRSGRLTGHGVCLFLLSSRRLGFISASDRDAE